MMPEHLPNNEPNKLTPKRCLSSPETSSLCGQTKRRKSSSCSPPCSIALPNELLVESIKFLDFNTLNTCREVAAAWNNVIVEHSSQLPLQFLNYSFTMDLNEYDLEPPNCSRSQVACFPICSKTWVEKGSAQTTQMTNKPILISNPDSIDVVLTVLEENQTHGPSGHLSSVFVGRAQCTVTPPLFSATFDEGITSADTFPHILHWIQHLCSPFTYFAEVNLMPFDVCFLNTISPNTKIHSKEVTIARCDPQDIDWLIGFAEKHCRCHTLIWAFDEEEVTQAREVELERSQKLLLFLLTFSGCAKTIEIIDLPVSISLYLTRGLVEKLRSSADIDKLPSNIQLNGYQRSDEPVTCALSFISAEKRRGPKKRRIVRELKAKNAIVHIEVDIDKEFYDVEMTIERV